MDPREATETSGKPNNLTSSAICGRRLLDSVCSLTNSSVVTFSGRYVGIISDSSGPRRARPLIGRPGGPKLGIRLVRTPRLALLAGGLAFSELVLAGVLRMVIEAAGSYESPLALQRQAGEMLVPLVYTAVGVFVAYKRPENLVPWSMLLSGIGWFTGTLLIAYGELALLARPEWGLPFGLEVAALSSGFWTALMAGVFLLIVLFPAGRAPSKFWRFFAPTVLAGFLLVWFAIATAPVGVKGTEFEPPFDVYDKNPLALTNSAVHITALFAVLGFCLISIGIATIDIIVRLVRSKGEERQQYKWFALAAGVLAASLPFSGANHGVITEIANVTFLGGLVGLPAAVGVAILRYRLYAIDRVLNRTLVYALLTAMLGLTYFGLVVGLQAALRSVSGGSDLAIVVTTLVVAALFLPARRGIQEVVDRRFNRRAYDAARTVDAFSARLREQIDLDTLRYELLGVVNETMQPAKATLWLRRPDTGR